MAEAFDRIASPEVEQLSEHVRDLERRVSLLEGKAAKPNAALQRVTPPRRPPEPEQGFPLNEPAGVLPVLGKAVLGIAGAYLLRAIAESGTLPKLPLLLVAIAYAGVWLLWAVRTHATNRFASVTYAITAAVILSPLLWESTVRFQVLPPVFAALVLVAFVVLALALAWRQDLQAIPWVAMVAAVATVVALLIATRELVPFTAALLALGLVAEAAACLGQMPGWRAVPAIAADLSVCLLIYVMTSPDVVRSEYQPISAVTISALSLALPAIYGGSLGVRIFGLRQRMNIFDVAQTVVVFIIATFGSLRASPGSAPPLGVFLLTVAAACYWGTLSRFTAAEQTRNRRVCATYAVASLLAGSLLLLPEALQAPFSCLAAVTAAFLYTRTKKLSLGAHVSFYLAAAAVLSGFLNLGGSALAGTVPPFLNTSAWVVAVSAGLCYAIGSRTSSDQWKQRLLWVVPCVLVAGGGAALAVMASVRLSSASGMLNASRLSVVRTVVICSVTLILGFCGSHLKRAELLWVAYAATAFGTAKLLFEDLPFGNAASLVASFLFYGLILILLPRLIRSGRNRPG